jgi:hypothetical protein
MSKKHLLIDSGWLKYACYWASQRQLKSVDYLQLAKHPKVFETMYDCVARMLALKIRNAVGLIGQLDAVHICLDDGYSWRAGLTMPKTPVQGDSGIVYKSHRNDPMDKEMIFAKARLNKWYLEVIKIISDFNGFNVHELLHVEADDILTILSKHLSDQGDICITASHDYDNTQSAYSNPDTEGIVINCYIGQFGNPDKLFIDHWTNSKLSETSIFGNSLVNKLGPQSMTLPQYANVLAKQYMLFEKIMRGDDSDGISPLMIRITNDKNGKPREYALAPKAIPGIIQGIGERNGLGYLAYETLYDTDEMQIVINEVHNQVHKHKLDIDNEWFKFYMQKYEFNRKLICCNLTEIGQSMHDAITSLFIDYSKLPVGNIAPYHIMKQVG